MGQTVQCAHCEQLFIATPPVSEGEAPAEQVAAAELAAGPSTSPLQSRNPAEDEPLPPTQETYKQARTLREMLVALSEVTSSGEVQLSNEEGRFDPSQLLTLLPGDLLRAKIVGRGADQFGNYIEFEAPQPNYFRFMWSPTREGWAYNWPDGRTLHYFIPKSAMHEPPYCGDGKLVALCKRNFHDADEPMHRNSEAKRCTICLERRGKMLGYDAPKRAVKKAVRVTLTKTQSETNAGRHLLQLISGLANDRVLKADELHLFRQSLDDPELQELNATQWLKESLDAVLADGYVTREEYYSVISSILRVLPSEIRSDWENRMRSGDRPATDKQVDYIKGLGGEVPEGMTVKQASATIDSLLRARGYDPETNY